MLVHMRTCLIVLAVSTTVTAQAGEPNPAVRAEITSLLARLEASGCRFNRNGTWYSAPDAKHHMLVKLRYIEDRTTLASAEQFIELAGSKSSITGKPYLVQCGEASAQTSATWLTAQLNALRAARAGQVKSGSEPTAPKLP
ncbi:hypothetical protein LMG31506_04786 [Cupriavidus yeoncheonensis]|uniref:DUF5329 domain-containing protein n=1 Tax=Cupriavidus yeoncheonensis TaxID=1462994 RepID=A0A916J0X7_9BURK|nr:DUF5329 domain-containing protein [Cupriavidus yeoncheonensis]CAG2153261.1 hypothetical protein LMG31506_04786 [Cupriavidus yeoncheonensis]